MKAPSLRAKVIDDRLGAREKFIRKDRGIHGASSVFKTIKTPAGTLSTSTMSGVICLQFLVGILKHFQIVAMANLDAGSAYAMSNGKHYFVEENDEGKFAVRAKGSERASRLADTQKEAEKLVKQFNPYDQPDIERVRNTTSGKRDHWRAK